MDPHWFHGFIVDPDPDPGSQTNADPPHPDPGKAFKTQKFKFLHEKYTKVGTITGLKITFEDTKAFLKGRKPGLFVIFVNFHAPGSGSVFHIGSGSRTAK